MSEFSSKFFARSSLYAVYANSRRFLFLVADTQLYKRLCPSVGRLVTLELKSGKTRISAPAHPSATDGRVSGLVLSLIIRSFPIYVLCLKNKSIGRSCF